MKEFEQAIDFGPVGAFAELPAQVILEHAPYWLVRTPDGGYRLWLAVCPHAGGEIRPLDGMFFCPLHFWTFDAASGACLHDPEERLLYREVREREGRLYAVGGNV